MTLELGVLGATAERGDGVSCSQGSGGCFVPEDVRTLGHALQVSGWALHAGNRQGRWLSNVETGHASVGGLGEPEQGQHFLSQAGE